MSDPALKVRQCAECKEASMVPVSRTMQIYNSVVHYKCSKCATEVDITPMGSIGVTVTVGLMALGFWGYVLFSDFNSPGSVAVTIFALAIAALAWITLMPLIMHLHYPISRLREAPRTPKLDTRGHIGAKLILLIEGFGLIGGLLAPIVFAVTFLGIAALIGYINFTYF